MSSGITESEFQELSAYIETECGIALSADKAYLVETRLTRLMALNGCETYGEFVRHIKSKNDAVLRDKIIDAMTTNETLWFRDTHPYTILREKILPGFLERAGSQPSRKMRIWSAASSTGQEPYSMAITLLEECRRNPLLRPENFEIVATDISHTALAVAKAGRYDPLAISRGMPEDLKSRYFKQDGRVWVLEDAVKNLVKFQRFNLQDSPRMLGNFDSVWIRYVLIYFSVELKQRIIDGISQVIDPQGALIIGGTESLRGVNDRFKPALHAGGTYHTLS